MKQKVGQEQQKYQEHHGQATAVETLALLRALATEGRPAAAEIPRTSRTSNRRNASNIRTSQTSNSSMDAITAGLLTTERDDRNIRYQENHQQQHQLINAERGCKK